MKKILVLFALIFPLVFSSCSKDDDPKEPSIENTKWVNVESGISATLHFVNKTECTWTLKTSDDKVHSSELYTYVYSDPTVTMTPKKTTLAKLRGTISGSGMTLYNMSQNTEIGIYLRK